MMFRVTVLKVSIYIVPLYFLLVSPWKYTWTQICPCCEIYIHIYFKCYYKIHEIYQTHFLVILIALFLYRTIVFRIAPSNAWSLELLKCSSFINIMYGLFIMSKTLYSIPLYFEVNRYLLILQQLKEATCLKHHNHLPKHKHSRFLFCEEFSADLTQFLCFPFSKLFKIIVYTRCMQFLSLCFKCMWSRLDPILFWEFRFSLASYCCFLVYYAIVSRLRRF